jgi:ATP-dependent helicase HrpA
VLATGHDLQQLRETLAGPVRASVVSAVASELERTGLRDWPSDLDELPRLVERTRDGHVVRGYPALVEEGDTVSIRVFPTELEQAAAGRLGARRLLRLAVPLAARAVAQPLSTRSKIVLAANPDGGVPQLLEDCADAVADALIEDRGVPFGRTEFSALCERSRAEQTGRAQRVVADVEVVLTAVQQVRAALPDRPPPALAPAVADMRAQLAELLPPGFVAAAGAGRLRDLARYVQAVGRRMERLPRDVALDSALMLRVEQVRRAYETLRAALPPIRASADDVREIGRQLQELRVSLFAQQLGTPRPVSEQRIYKAIDAVRP